MSDNNLQEQQAAPTGRNPRPTDAEIAAMLVEAANRIEAKCRKGIREDFSDRNFAANSLRLTADRLTPTEERPAASGDTTEHTTNRDEAL